MYVQYCSTGADGRGGEASGVLHMHIKSREDTNSIMKCSELIDYQMYLKGHLLAMHEIL